VQRLAVGTVRSLTKETCYQFRDVHDHLIQLHDSLDDHRETLSGLRDTYLGVVNNRMSEVMKSLTVFSAILLPLAFLTGLWGMNVKVPWEGDPKGFFYVLGFCALSTLGALQWMWRRGYLKRIQ
jgi:magnesium transporter